MRLEELNNLDIEDVEEYEEDGEDGDDLSNAISMLEDCAVILLEVEKGSSGKKLRKEAKKLSLEVIAFLAEFEDEEGV